MRRYRSEANDRWVGFEHRPGDIVISTRSKCGTTWLQMICALLVFGDAELPAPLAELSPWLDWEVEPVNTVRDRLDRQTHRRFVKTHTPLDGLPLDRSVTYLVAGRHPLDVAESLYAHGHNIDRDRFEALTGRRTVGPQGTFPAWLGGWMDPDTDPQASLDTLPGLVHHLVDAWHRQGDLDVVLVHYDDLIADLAGEMHRLAGHLGIVVPEDRWPQLVRAAGFASMRADAARLAPDHLGVLRRPDGFFRAATTARGVGSVPAEVAAECRRTVEARAPRELAAWLWR
jgi:hypothetical protein